MRVQDLLEESAETQVQVGSDKAVGLVYRLFWDELFAEDDWDSIKQLRGREYMAALLPKLLVSWDIQDADGAAIPVTAEAITAHKVPMRFLRMVEKAVLEAADGPKGSAASSLAG